MEAGIRTAVVAQAMPGLLLAGAATGTAHAVAAHLLRLTRRRQ